MGKKRILVCDDEEGVRESLNLILENNYEVSFATNGREAIEYIRKNPADLVILDTDTPLVDGQVAHMSLQTVGSLLRILFDDANLNNLWDSGEDIVLDVNGNGVYDAP